MDHPETYEYYFDKFGFINNEQYPDYIEDIPYSNTKPIKITDSCVVFGKIQIMSDFTTYGVLSKHRHDGPAVIYNTRKDQYPTLYEWWVNGKKIKDMDSIHIDFNNITATDRVIIKLKLSQVI